MYYFCCLFIIKKFSSFKLLFFCYYDLFIQLNFIKKIKYNFNNLNLRRWESTLKKTCQEAWFMIIIIMICQAALIKDCKCWLYERRRLSCSWTERLLWDWIDCVASAEADIRRLPGLHHCILDHDADPDQCRSLTRVRTRAERASLSVMFPKLCS